MNVSKLTIFRYLRRIKNEIKSAWQEEFRGFSDDSLYNFDSTIAAFIAPRLKVFKRINNGYPAHLTEHEWNTILDKMIFAFEYTSSEQKYTHPQDKELYKRYEEGIELFKTYFHHLWI